MTNRTGFVVLLTALLLAIGLVVTASSIAGEEPTVEEIFADRTNETTKQEIAAEDALLQSIGEAHPAPAPENPEAARPERDPADFAWEEGIFEDAEFPIGLGFDFENVWKGHREPWHVIAFAGALRDDPWAGVVLVQLKDPETWGTGSRDRSGRRSPDRSGSSPPKGPS